MFTTAQAMLCILRMQRIACVETGHGAHEEPKKAAGVNRRLFNCLPILAKQDGANPGAV
jgi:hypothetical protein